MTLWSHLFTVVYGRYPEQFIWRLFESWLKMPNVTSSVYMRLVLKWNSSKAKSPVDPCTVTEQFDVNQQASAVGLYCF